MGEVDFFFSFFPRDCVTRGGRNEKNGEDRESIAMVVYE
jgi:hypothetical protein